MDCCRGGKKKKSEKIVFPDLGSLADANMLKHMLQPHTESTIPTASMTACGPADFSPEHYFILKTNPLINTQSQDYCRTNRW